MTEYPTLTALMQGREPGSVKVREPNVHGWYRVGRLNPDSSREALDMYGYRTVVPDIGPWLIVSEDAPAIDTLRLQMAATILAGLHAATFDGESYKWADRHAYALAEADALITESRRK